MNITPFNFKNNDIRVIQDNNGEPWFIAMDVASILDYSDTEAMTRKLDNDEVKNRQIIGFGNRGTSLINESGLYSVILRSGKPEAKPFKKWVTSEVLPSIRKTGAYSVKTSLPDFTNPATAARAWADEVDKSTALEKQVKIDAPKVKFAEAITESSNTRCIRIWVKAMKSENNLTVGEREVFKFLVDKKYIYKQDKGYLPYAIYESNGRNYFEVVIDEINGKPRRQLKITGKGVVALTEKVIKHFFNKLEAA